MRHALDCFVHPKSVAVIGASTVLHKTGGRRWRSMVEAGFAGPLYPVHPTAAEILGHKAYRSIREVPGPVDLAVVLVRSDLVLGVIRDCAELRIPGVVVITAGFGETGAEGKRLEREMVGRLGERGGRLIGPNCAGLFSASGRVNVLGWDVPAGPVALISQSGNMALGFAQLAREKGLGFSKLITIGADVLPSRSTIINPVDFAGVAEEEPEVVPRVLDACLADPEIGGVILAGHFGGYFKIATEELGQREQIAARGIAEVVRRRAKPVVVHTIYGAERLPALEELRRAGIPIYRSLEASAMAMGSLWRYSRACERRRALQARRSRPDAVDVAAILDRASDGTDRLLLEPEARGLLALYGIPVPPFRVSTSPEETAVAAAELGGPVVLKLIAAGLVHKSDVGAVSLDVPGPEAASAGHRRLMEQARAIRARRPRVLITGMIPDGIETVIGAFRDPQFGPVVMFGLGGIFVEALDDVAFRLAPLDELDAEAMINEVRAHRVFGGVRGRPPRDLVSLVDVLIRVSELAADRPEVVELDLNPVFLLARGAAVADARVVLA